MFIQREVLRKSISMSLNNTYKLDLPDHGMLTSLLFRFTGSQKTGYGQGVESWRIIDELSKITLLGNASTIIKSMTCKQAQAAAFYDQGVVPPGDWRMYATNTQTETMLVNFGRRMGDTQYGLDLSRWNNVELQLTNIADATDFTDLNITVIGIFMRDVPASQFQGYFRTEEWKRWTTVSDQTVYNELPVSHPLRRIFLQALPDKDGSWQYETNMYNQMYDIQLALDTGQVNVFSGGLEALMYENYLDLGKPAFVSGQTYQTADVGTDLSIGRMVGLAGLASTKDGAVAASIPTVKADETHGTITPEVYAGDEPVSVIAYGISPFHIAYFDFGMDDDPANYLDPDARKTVKLDIKTRSGATYADGTNAVILDRLVRH